MTKVKVEFFKNTGKFYTCFEYETILAPFQTNEIKEEVKTHKEFIKGMNFLIETGTNGWNKYLFLEAKD